MCWIVVDRSEGPVKTVFEVRRCCKKWVVVSSGPLPRAELPYVSGATTDQASQKFSVNKTGNVLQSADKRLLSPTVESTVVG